MSEFDELVSRRGVIMAGKFGPFGRLAEHKSESLYLEDPRALEMAHWFSSAVTLMFASMAASLDQPTVAGSWLPMAGWTYSGGDYGIAVHGSHFVFVESAKIDSLDGMASLLRQLES